MKKLIVTNILVLLSLVVWSQKSSDIGLQIGAATYWGDIQNVDYSKAITPIGGVLGRWNFNSRLSLRGQLVIGTLEADGVFVDAYTAQPETKKSDGYYLWDKTEAFNFYRSFQSVEALIEFNFRNYLMGNMKNQRFTPFVFIGVGGFFSRSPRRGTLILDQSIIDQRLASYYPPYLNSENNKSNDVDAQSVTIPIGMGIKYNLTNRLGASLDFSVRKTFIDNIDNLDDPKRFQDFKPSPQNGGKYPDSLAPNIINHSDWYASINFSIYYQLWHDKGNCWVYDKKKKK